MLDAIDVQADILPEILFPLDEEADMSGADPALGMNASEDLTPSTNTDAFTDRFRKNIAILEGLGDSMDLTFQYTCTHRVSSTKVMIRTCRDDSDQNRLIVPPMR
jgi:hypothetical protein